MSTGVPAIEVTDVCVRFGETEVLHHVNLRVEEGEFVGVVGRNGGGKSVLLGTLLGLVRHQEGTVRLFGRPPEELRGRIGYVPQYTTFDRDFPISVRQLVSTGRLGRRGPFARPNAADVRRIEEVLERVELSDRADDPVGVLSGGQLRRALLARAIVMDVGLLLLDEPAAGLDPRVADSVHDLLVELAGDHTIVLVSHDLDAVRGRVDALVCVNRRVHVHRGSELTPELLGSTFGAHLRPLAEGTASLHDLHHHEGERP